MSGALQKRIDRAKKVRGKRDPSRSYVDIGKPVPSGKDYVWTSYMTDERVRHAFQVWNEKLEYDYAALLGWCLDAEKSRGKKWVRKAMGMSKEEYKFFRAGVKGL